MEMTMSLYKPAFIHKLYPRRRVLLGWLAIFLFLAGAGQWLPAAAYLPPPVVNDQNFSVLENSANGTVVGTVIATDADTYAIIDGNELGAFAINSSTGLLTVANGAQIDYESNPVFELTVEVTNIDGTDSGLMTINVINVNDAPVVEDQEFDVIENSPNGTVVGTIIATDPDGNDLSYTILFGNTGNTFALNLTSGEVTVFDNTLLDPQTNPVFTLLVQVSDGGLHDTAVITINVVEEVNAPPTVDEDTFFIDENSANGTAVGTVTATDPNNDPLTFSIIAGNSNNAFAIGSSSGQLTVNNSAALDFETMPVFVLTVRAQDPGGLSGTADITINLNDINEAPTINPDTFTIPENSPNDTSVGTVMAFDPDAGDTLTYGIIAGNIADAFAINAGSGAITVSNSAALDYETNPTFLLTVRVTDTGSLTAEALITINLENENEFPPEINPQTFTIAENAANGAIVGTIVITDGDDIDFFTLNILTGDPAGVFTINNAGVIAVADNSTLDFETTPSYSLDVEVTDSGGLTDTAVMTINVLDANDAPIINDEDLTVTPAAIQETETITLTGVFTDQDSGDAHTITILWGDGASDILNLAAGVMDFSASHAYLDDPTGLPDDYTIQVTVADDLASDSASATVTVSNIPPTLDSLTASPDTLDEGEAISLSGAFSEASPLDSFTVTVDWGDGIIESFNYPAGAASFLETHTYQDNFNPAIIVVTLVDDDGGSDTGSTAVTINNLPPLADAGPNRIVPDGTPADFSGAASDPGAWDTLTFEWDFGDGSSDSGTLTPSHLYPAPGVYTATLTVTDDDGDSASDTAVVFVLAPSDLVGLKTVSGSFNEGGAVTYTIILSNTGDTEQPDNPGPEFLDELPEQLALVSAQIVSGGGNLDVNTFANIVTWNGAIPDGSSITLEIQATILPGFHGQTVSNQGQIFYDGNGDGQNESFTFTDDPTQPGMFDATTFTILGQQTVYLPIIMNHAVSVTAPDLVITAINASSSQIEVTLENQGTAATTSGFWVDFYINPNDPPSGANQLWHDLANEGIAWGVTALLDPGASLTLIYSTAPGAPNQYFVAAESVYHGSLPAGTLVYAQVDSAREGDPYGGILELHEITGGAYNNILSGTAVAPE